MEWSEECYSPCVQGDETYDETGDSAGCGGWNVLRSHWSMPPVTEPEWPGASVKCEVYCCIDCAGEEGRRGGEPH